MNIYRIRAKNKQCSFIPFIDLKISSIIKPVDVLVFTFTLPLHGYHSRNNSHNDMSVIPTEKKKLNWRSLLTVLWVFVFLFFLSMLFNFNCEKAWLSSGHVPSVVFSYTRSSLFTLHLKILNSKIKKKKKDYKKQQPSFTSG